jgi:hypothetical protein
LILIRRQAAALRRGASTAGRLGRRRGAAASATLREDGGTREHDEA